MEPDEKHEHQRRIINSELKKQLFNIQNVSIEEMEVIFSIIQGADFQGLQTGQQAITKNNELVTILGYSNNWKADADISTLENDKAKKLNVNISHKEENQQVIALFFDPLARERQEIIKLNPFEITPLLDLNKESLKHKAQSSLLNESDILRHFVGILTTKEEQKTSENKLFSKQLKLHVLKSLTHMISVCGDDYLKLLQSEGVLSKFVQYLYEVQSQESKESKLIPINWVELRASNIKRAALENDASLIINQNSLSASINNGNQIVLSSVDQKTSQQTITNTFLRSAINLQNLEQSKKFSCVLSKDLVVFDNQVASKSTILQKQFGMVFVQGQDLIKMDEKSLQMLLKSEIILTTTDINPKELFTKMVEATKKDDEKDEKERTLYGLLESIVLFVTKADFERIQQPIQLVHKPFLSSASTMLEGLLLEISAWTGIDKDTLLFHLGDFKDLPFNTLAMKVISVLKTLNTDKVKVEEKIKKLEIEKKFKELETYQNQLSKVETKKNQEKAEKLETLKQKLGLSEGQQIKQSLVEKIVSEADSKEIEENFNKEPEIVDILSDVKNKEKIEKIIDKFIAPFSDDKDQNKAKTDEQMSKEYFKQVLEFNYLNLHNEYNKTLSTLHNLYSRKSLINILLHADPEQILPILLNGKRNQKLFNCFIKSSYNEAIIMKLTSGSNDQLKQIKQIIRTVFEFCNKKEDFSQYIRDFLRYELIDSGILTIKKFVEVPPKGVQQYFVSEQIALLQLNPFLLTFMVKLYIQNSTKYLLEHKFYLPQLYSLLLGYFVYLQEDKKSQILIKILNSIIQSLKYIENNLEYSAKNGQLDKYLNSDLFKLIQSSINFSDDANYSSQQKLVLEIQMKLLDLHQIVLQQGLANLDTNLENSLGILKVKRGKQTLQEKDKFNFLRYFIHHQGLDLYQKEMLNQAIETNHTAFDVKVLAKYSINQIEKLTIKFNEKNALKDFTFLGIGQNASGKDIKYFSQEDLQKENKEQTFFKGEFYLYYPIRKQIIVAFGEGSNDRLGLANSNKTEPKPCYNSIEQFPTKVLSSYFQSVFIDKENDLYRCGSIKKCGVSQHSSYEKQTLKSKVRFVSMSKFAIVVILEDNTIWGMGYSKDGHLGPNESYTTFTKFQMNDDQEQITEKIIEVTSGTHYTLFITESGKLYGTGNRFLKEIGLDGDNQIIQIPLKENVKALKAWGSAAKSSPCAIIKVELQDGSEQLWSAGRNEQGLLGQGALIKQSKQFRPVKYDHTQIKFVDVSLHTEHIMAIDQNANLYAWGNNLSKRSGFKEDIFDGVYEPKKVIILEQQKLKPIRVSCGFDHTLIMVENEEKKRKLYSFGIDDTNYHHLGISALDAEDKVTYFREIQAFNGFNVVDFTAGHRSSHVIIEGDKTPLDNLYQHSIGEAEQKKEFKGLLHFYKKDNIWHYVGAEEYEAKKDSLPDLCFAIKCPIIDIEKRSFPDLELLSKEVIDSENAANIHSVECNVTNKQIQGSRYFAFSKINGDNMKVNLSEKGIQYANQFDINPLIYYRINKPLKEGSKLPIIDLKDFYNISSAFGLDITVEHDAEFQQNDKIIELTKTSFEELNETISKFPSEFDSELLKEMDKYIKTSLIDKAMNDIIVKEHFKIADMNFKNPKLKKILENVKRKRIELYFSFNKIFLELMPFISLEEKASSGDMSKMFSEVKGMILFSMKNKFLQKAIDNLPSGSQSSCEIRRRKAQRFSESGKCDHKGEHTIFGQIFQQIKDHQCFRQNSTDSKTWSTRFAGEGSIDAGGPYREALTNMCSEIESDSLPLMIKTANNRNNHGENRDCFIPSPHSNNPTHLQLFDFFGKLLGYAIRTLSPLPLHLAPAFWKQLLGETLDVKDLKGIDTFTWQVIEDLKKQSEKLSEKEFNDQVEEMFVTRLSDGVEVELEKGGKQRRVTKANLNEYIELILKKRFSENATQIKAIRDGVDYVIPMSQLKIFTWEEVETRACGDKIIETEKLKKMTEYYCATVETEGILRFWRVFEDLTEEEKQLYLKFAWGRCRLPYEIEGLRDKHCLSYESHWGDDKFPVAHTCFFQVDLPAYTNDEICKKRIVTAITMCGEIDADRDAAYIDDDNDAEEE